MLCLAVEKLPEGPAWQYEVKLDGYRAIGVRTRSSVELWSRNKRDFSRRFANIGLLPLPQLRTPSRLVPAVKRHSD
jgi:ATP-dependent DNA ligase